MTTHSEIIHVQNVSKRFTLYHEKKHSIREYVASGFKGSTSETLEALKGVTFAVKRGEFLGVIGRNGSGKSTLLKILAGVYTPDKGDIKVLGKVSPFLELGVGFNGELTARENIFLNGAILGLNRIQIEQRFEEIIRFAELERFIDTKIKKYSSGMYARLAFSVAVQVDADIFIMDEVLAVGDANFQEKCLTVFKKLIQEGKTIIFVSHAMGNIEAFCDRVVLLEQGQIKAIGDPKTVIHEYNQLNTEREEKRLQEENEQKKEVVATAPVATAPVQEKTILTVEKAARSGTGRLKIEDVMILNNKEKEKYIFSQGDDILFRIKLAKNGDVEKVNVGIGLYDQDTKMYVAGINTQMDAFQLAPTSNEVTLRFKKIPLQKGTYTINVVAFGEDEKNYDDWLGNYKTFKIVTEDAKYRGNIHLEHEWIRG